MQQTLLEFWRLLADEQVEVAGGVGLASPPVPLSFANGVWQPDPHRLTEVATWCRHRGMPPAILWTGDETPPRAGDLALEVRLVVHRVDPTPAGTQGGAIEVVIEQIGWQHCRPMAELFARKHDRMDVEEELTLVLARALQRDARTVAYLAYDGDRVAAAGLALIAQHDAVAWLDGEAEAALVAQLAHDAPASNLHLMRAPAPASSPGPGVARWLIGT